MFDEQPSYHTRIYQRRWLILSIFCLLSFSNAGQWISFAVISDIVQSYYRVSAFSVNCLSMIFMAVYIMFIVPATWVLDKYGLKVGTVLGAFFNAAGGWMKFGGTSRAGFAWVVAGQTITSIGQCFILGVPPRLAAAWFAENERSTATSLGVFANQVGVAVYFAVIPNLVPNSFDENTVRGGIDLLYGGVAMLCTVIGGIVLVAFEAAPPIPPSQSQAVLAEQGEERRLSYWESLLCLLKNPSYMLLLITYGIYCGSSYTVATLLNEIVTSKFPNQEVVTGLLGFTFTLCGLPGIVLAGVLLDRTLAYKKGTIFLVSFAFFGLIGFAISFEVGRDIYALFPIIALLGFFATSFIPLGFEFAAELTYPVPESTSAGLLNTSAQLFGIVFIVVVGEIINRYDVLVGNLILIGSLLVGVAILPFVKSDLRRQRVDTRTDYNEHGDGASGYQPILDTQ